MWGSRGSSLKPLPRDVAQPQHGTCIWLLSVHVSFTGCNDVARHIPRGLGAQSSVSTILPHLPTWQRVTGVVCACASQGFWGQVFSSTRKHDPRCSRWAGCSQQACKWPWPPFPPQTGARLSSGLPQCEANLPSEVSEHPDCIPCLGLTNVDPHQMQTPRSDQLPRG